jgi:hypothetical protein
MDHLLAWFKPIYELVGTPFPKTSLIAVMVLGAAISGGFWSLVGKQVAKDNRQQSLTNGSASTSASQSPAISGNGNSVTYDTSAPSDKKSEPAKNGEGR